MDDCTLIPPLSPGARRSVGVARLGNRVTLTLRASGSENQQAERDALDAVATAIALTSKKNPAHAIPSGIMPLSSTCTDTL